MSPDFGDDRITVVVEQFTQAGATGPLVVQLRPDNGAECIWQERILAVAAPTATTFTWLPPSVARAPVIDEELRKQVHHAWLGLRLKLRGQAAPAFARVVNALQAAVLALPDASSDVHVSLARLILEEEAKP